MFFQKVIYFEGAGRKCSGRRSARSLTPPRAGRSAFRCGERCNRRADSASPPAAPTPPARTQHVRPEGGELLSRRLPRPERRRAEGASAERRQNGPNPPPQWEGEVVTFSSATPRPQKKNNRKKQGSVRNYRHFDALLNRFLLPWTTRCFTDFYRLFFRLRKRASVR